MKNCKQTTLRSLAAALSVLLLIPGLTVFATPEEGTASFPDIESHWAYDDIIWASDEGIAYGMQNGDFEPDTPLSRAMFVSFLQRLTVKLGFNLAGYEETILFNDQPAGAWYAEPLAWASVNTIVNGYDNGNFGPNDLLTREQMAVILYKYFSLWLEDRSLKPTGSLSYRDSTSVSAWAKNAVSALSTIELLKGGSDGKFAPVRACTRAEAVSVIRRVADIAQARGLLYPGVYMKTGANLYTYRAYVDFPQVHSGEIGDFLYECGFDFIRIPIGLLCENSEYEVFSYSVDPNTKKAILKWKDGFLEAIVDAAQSFADRGFTVILDLHDVREQFDRLGLNINSGVGQQLVVGAWDAFAAASLSLPDRVFFELINEMELSRETIELCIEKIRSYDAHKNRILLVYAYYWGDAKHNKIPDLGKFSDDKNIMFDIHNYQPDGFTLQGGYYFGVKEYVPGTAVGDKIEEKMSVRIKAAAELQQITGRKVIIGEFGLCQIRESRALYVTKYRRTLLENGITSSALWGATHMFDHIGLNFYNYVFDEYDPVMIGAMFGRT